MQNASEYLEKTRSAAALLFEGIDSYLALLRNPDATFVASYSSQEDLQEQFEAWSSANQSHIQAAAQSQRRFMAERFAQATLCGAVLQLAAKAIECYSTNSSVLEDWSLVQRPNKNATKFHIGRYVRGVPLGLIIYAGRNQHTHFEDRSLREPNTEVFRRLSLNHGYCKESTVPVIDPNFHLDSHNITSFANQIIALIGWRKLEHYERDIRELLDV